MANKIVLNETSYHGKGAILNVPAEAKLRGFKKAFICSDPDLVKFNVTKKVTDLLIKRDLSMNCIPISRQILLLRMFKPEWKLSKNQGRTI